MPIEYTAREIKKFEEHIRKAIQFCYPGLLEQAAAYQFSQLKEKRQQVERAKAYE